MARISKTQLIRLQKKLKTDAAIGQQFGITRQAVHQLRKKYAIDSSLIDNPKRNSEIVKAYKEGASGTALAKKFKLSISQTYRIINESKGVAKKKKTATKKKSVKAAKKKAVTKKTIAKKPAAKKAPAKKAAKKPAKKAAKAPAKKTKKAVPAKKKKAPAKKKAGKKKSKR